MTLTTSPLRRVQPGGGAGLSSWRGRTTATVSQPAQQLIDLVAMPIGQH
jgi:hypothetical protein